MFSLNISTWRGVCVYVFLYIFCVQAHPSLCKDGRYRDGEQCWLFDFCLLMVLLCRSWGEKGIERSQTSPRAWVYLLNDMFIFPHHILQRSEKWPSTTWPAFPSFGHYSNSLSLAAYFTRYLIKPQKLISESACITYQWLWWDAT